MPRPGAPLCRGSSRGGQSRGPVVGASRGVDAHDAGIKAFADRLKAPGLFPEQTIVAVARKPIIGTNAVLNRETPWAKRRGPSDQCYPHFASLPSIAAIRSAVLGWVSSQAGAVPLWPVKAPSFKNSDFCGPVPIPDLTSRADA